MAGGEGNIEASVGDLRGRQPWPGPDGHRANGARSARPKPRHRPWRQDPVGRAVPTNTGPACLRCAQAVEEGADCGIRPLLVGVGVGGFGAARPKPSKKGPARDLRRRPAGRVRVIALCRHSTQGPVEDLAVRSGLLPRDPLAGDAVTQTANVAGRTVIGCATGLLGGRGDCLTNGLYTGLETTRRQTTLGQRAVQDSLTVVPGSRADAAGDSALNAGGSVLNALGLLGPALQGGVQTVAAAAAAAIDGADIPLEERLRILGEEPGIRTTQQGLSELRDGVGRTVTRAVAAVAPPTGCDSSRWVSCPGSPGHPAGQPRVGPAVVGPRIRRTRRARQQRVRRVRGPRGLRRPVAAGPARLRIRAGRCAHRRRWHGRGVRPPVPGDRRQPVARLPPGQRLGPLVRRRRACDGGVTAAAHQPEPGRGVSPGLFR